MKILKKVKNMFTEEVEEDDVKVEKIKKEVTHVAIESPVVKEDEDLDDDLEDRITFTAEKNEKPKPIFFDDNDFEDLKLTKHSKYDSEEKEKSSLKNDNLYKADIKIDEISKEKKIFKPTPIISPVYGVLDKNYHKEDIVSREERKNEHSSEVSQIDTIRNKAYGTLEDELENTLFGSNSILFKKDEKEENKLEVKEVDDEVLTDLTDDISKELDELLIKKEKYISNDEKNSLEDEDLLGFIDSTLYKDGDE